MIITKFTRFTRENAAEWAGLDHVYAYISDPKNNSGRNTYREDREVFRTIEEANNYARIKWVERLPWYKAESHVYVCRIGRDNLNNELFRDGFPVDWLAFEQTGSREGCFDSVEYERKAKEEREKNNIDEVSQHIREMAEIFIARNRNTYDWRDIKDARESFADEYDWESWWMPDLVEAPEDMPLTLNDEREINDRLKSEWDAVADDLWTEAYADDAEFRAANGWKHWFFKELGYVDDEEEETEDA